MKSKITFSEIGSQPSRAKPPHANLGCSFHRTECGLALLAASGIVSA
jgi:hypothetical protein